MAEIRSPGLLRTRDKTHWTIPQLLIIAGVFLLLYLPFLSIDYDANGVIEAMDVETGRRLSPNHLLYTLLGRALFEIAQAFGYGGRAIYVLQTFNALCGAVGVALACVAFVKLGASKRAALAAAGLWGTSFIYWYFSTDVAYVTLAGVFTAAALACCASQNEPDSVLRGVLLGLFVSLAILTFQMLVFLVPVMLWPLRHRARQAAAFVLSTVLIVGVTYITFGLLAGQSTPLSLVRWAAGYAGGHIPEWGRFEIARVAVAGGAAVRSFQWDVFAWGNEIIKNPFRPFVWRLGAGTVCFIALAILTFLMSIPRFADRDSRLAWMIGAYVIFCPFIIWFDPTASYWFLVPNLFLCASAALVWGPWLTRPVGFAVVFGGVSVMAAATFVSWVWNKHIDPGIVGRKVECIASNVDPGDTVIATDWTWPATLEYFHGVQPVQVIDLAASIQNREKLFEYISGKIRETRLRDEEVFIVDPTSYTREHLAWLAEQAQFAASDFERFPGPVVFQCEDAKFREVAGAR
jgi:hypothetical protein